MIYRGKTVAITGGGAGLGRALALGFAGDGARVVILGRTPQTLAEVVASGPTGMIHAVHGDVGNARDVKRFIEETQHLGEGKLDVLINNAAIYPRKDFLAMSSDEFDEVMRINVCGTAYGCRYALPGMLQKGHGRILNVGSFAYLGALPTASAYAVSKGGIRPLTKGIACEIDRAKHPNVLVNEFIPGEVKTSMSTNGRLPEELYPHARVLVDLPSGGPCGATFNLSTLFVEHSGGLKQRILRKAKALVGR
jgi:NAD(P)-dependent dehydrogenase (short-subunit alcohol dehydrogenase family)